ncbi:pseudouridine synthase [Patiriisocius marinus]|nr:pseudouridine synthase [Patiriisocius marinus]
METHRHFAIFKPYGMVSQFITNDRHSKNKKFLGELQDFPEGTMAIGRLDEPSEGLLLLTTDGKMSSKIRSRKTEKEYYVQVDGLITDAALKVLENGVEISVEGSAYKTLPSKVTLFSIAPSLPKRAKKIRDDRHGPTSWISIIITEGKFRQVRKMTAAVGFPTLRLVRYRVANITIDAMDAGDVKEIAL